MKLFETSHEYPHDWAAVTLAFWRKYPNPCTGHVKHVDILDRRVDPDTGILHTERLICCVQNVPTLIRKLFGASEETYAYEISEVDPKGKVLEARTVNLTFSNLIRVEERLSYSLANTSNTVFRQAAKISAFGSLSRFANYIEDFSVNRFRENAARGRRGFEWALDRLLAESQEAWHRAEGFVKEDLAIMASSPNASS